MARDIAQDTLNVGNAMASVRIDQMILNLAKGIAWGQFELDKVGIEITKMMGAPGTVSIGGEQLSMLEAGFTPSFYHFVDTILEMKMEINIREESSSSTNIKEKTSSKTSSNFNVSASASGSFFGAKVSASASYGGSSSSAYSKAVDSTSSQKFSQDLSASSLMRTKIVPVPPPELLLERIKILLEKLRKEAEEAEEASEAKQLSKLSDIRLTLIGTIITKEALDNPDKEIKNEIYKQFMEKGLDLLKSMEITAKDSDATSKRWILKDKAENKYIVAYEEEGDPATKTITVHDGGETQGEAFSFDDLFDSDMA